MSADYKPNGASVAALVSAAFGLLVLGLVVLATELSERAKEIVFDIGISWLVLHFALRHREVNTKAWFGLALATLVLATLLVWPPVWHYLG